MKIRSILSVLLVAAILAPISVLAAGAAPQQPGTPGPFVQRIQAQVRRQANLHKLTMPQRQALRVQVRSILAETRANLQAGPHTRGQLLKERIAVQLKLRKAIRQIVRGGH